ncbi:MAG: type II secretion system protein N [Povalibacter sp.]
MKRIWPVVLLGVIAYLVFAIATLPAQLLISRLSPAVSAAGVHGTVWNGQAEVVQIAGQRIGSVAWKLRAFPLFLGRFQGDAKITRIDGFAQGGFKARLSGALELKDLTASIPLTSLSVGVRGWAGTVNARLARLAIVNGWPTQAEGTIEVLDLTGPPNRPANMGGYKVTFPPGSGGDELVGALSDLGGPLNIAGNLRLKSDRSYVVEGAVAARPEAPKSVADSLQYLGPAEADGRRPFSIAGTF